MTLKERREQLGWSKRKAYQFLECSPVTYDRYENDPNLINTKTYQRYLEILKTATADFNKSVQVIDSSSDDFASIRGKGAFYVDKTLLIKEIIESGETSLLFARPRRFGKSLNLSMIRHFFDFNSDPSLFDGLVISKEVKICETYQNKYPVLYLVLKEVEGPTSEDFLYRLNEAVVPALKPFQALVRDSEIPDSDKEEFLTLISGKATASQLRSSLKMASRLLFEITGKKVVILVDEYDVPLQKASMENYYDVALDVVGGLLSASLKGNEFLQLGIITGCLRIGKESIFTGLNNVSCHTFASPAFRDHFGFSEKEVDNALRLYELEKKAEEVRRYYGGFPGNGGKMYCPFDVVNYLADHRFDANQPPLYYWMNTSENEIIRYLLNASNPSIRDEIDLLIQGGAVKKTVDLYLTYRDLYSNASNIYSVLVSAGYLVTDTYSPSGSDLKIPNEEIRYIFQTQFMGWISNRANTATNKGELSLSLLQGDLKKASAIVTDFLWNTIGIHDYARPASEREGFYHGVLLGLLTPEDGSNYRCVSNKEAGIGFLDIALCLSDSSKGVIVECKYAEGGDFDKAFNEGERQIQMNRYSAFFSSSTEITCLVAVFYQKRCEMYLTNIK